MKSQEDEYEDYLRWRKKLVFFLVYFHFLAVLLFDLLAIYAPQHMSARPFSVSPVTFGITYAIAIVASVIISSFYYSHGVNRREGKLPEKTGE